VHCSSAIFEALENKSQNPTTQKDIYMNPLWVVYLLFSCRLNQTTDSSIDISEDTGEVSSLVGLGGFLLDTYYIFESADGFHLLEETTMNIHFKRSPEDELRFEFSGGCNVFFGDPRFDNEATMLMTEMFVSGTYNNCG